MAEWLRRPPGILTQPCLLGPLPFLALLECCTVRPSSGNEISRASLGCQWLSLPQRELMRPAAAGSSGRSPRHERYQGCSNPCRFGSRPARQLQAGSLFFLKQLNLFMSISSLIAGFPSAHSKSPAKCSWERLTHKYSPTANSSLHPLPPPSLSSPRAVWQNWKSSQPIIFKTVLSLNEGFTIWCSPACVWFFAQPCGSHGSL